MTSTQALQLTQRIIRNDLDVSGPLLKLLDAFATARGDPLGEAMTRDVMLLLYSKTDHCEEKMREFISQEQPVDQTRLVA